MAEIFLKNDVASLLKDKKLLLLGDSNVRALYKDLIWLLKCNTLIDANFLRRRLENQFLGDNLICRSELTRGRNFTEHRILKSNIASIEFIFITRCYSTQIENLFGAIKDGKREAPDVVYMNSFLWDVTRWGPNGVKEFQMNMRKLMKLLKSSLPTKTLFLWGTAIPTSSSISGGLIIKQLEFIQAALRVHVMEANRFTAALVSSYGFDVLDLHYFMHYQVCRRSADGVHYLPHAMRFITNLLLTHIALSWDVKLPRRIGVFPGPLEKVLRAANQVKTENVEGLVQKIDEIASNIDIIVNPQESSEAANNKKNKNKRKKRSKSKSTEKIPQTPYGYHKAPQHVFTGQNFNGPMLPNDQSNFVSPTPCNNYVLNESCFSVDNYDYFKGYNYHLSSMVRKGPTQDAPPNVWDLRNEQFYNPTNFNQNNQQFDVPGLRCTVWNNEPSTSQACSNRQIDYYKQRVTVQNHNSDWSNLYERRVSNTPNYVWPDNQTVWFGGGVMRSDGGRMGRKHIPYTRPDRRYN